MFLGALERGGLAAEGLPARCVGAAAAAAVEEEGRCLAAAPDPSKRPLPRLSNLVKHVTRAPAPSKGLEQILCRLTAAATTAIGGTAKQVNLGEPHMRSP